VEGQAADVRLGRRQLQVETLGEGHGTVARRSRDSGAFLFHAPVVLVEGEAHVGLVLVTLELLKAQHPTQEQ
jgi:hypothetical protein